MGGQKCQAGHLSEAYLAIEAFDENEVNALKKPPSKVPFIPCPDISVITLATPKHPKLAKIISYVPQKWPCDHFHALVRHLESQRVLFP